MSALAKSYTLILKQRLLAISILHMEELKQDAFD